MCDDLYGKQSVISNKCSMRARFHGGVQLALLQVGDAHRILMWCKKLFRWNTCHNAVASMMAMLSTLYIITLSLIPSAARGKHEHEAETKACPKRRTIQLPKLIVSITLHVHLLEYFISFSLQLIQLCFHWLQIFLARDITFCERRVALGKLKRHPPDFGTCKPNC